MPWRQTNPMDQRLGLIADWLRADNYITDIVRKYEISRKTAYKWIGRYEKEGLDGLQERSHAPKVIPRQTEERIVEMLIYEKCRHRSWGPKKIIAYLKTNYPYEEWPAPSTAGEWFKKSGLSRKRKRRATVPVYSEPFAKCSHPNDVWSADYKGHFRMENGRYCYPLTISDNNTRYLLAAKALAGTRYNETRRSFEAAFNKYGLPLAIRTDNGIPFAGKTVGGLSRLSVWWIKLGIIPERIDKGEPQQNGRHERMHRTLKEALNELPAFDLKTQQRMLDLFRIEYNEARPHEALGQKTPGSLYQRSNREYTDSPPLPEYDLDFCVRNVKYGGEIKFKGGIYFVSQVLAGERIGLKQIADDEWQINFSFQPIGIINLRRKIIEPLKEALKV